MIYAVNKRTKEHRIASQGSGTSGMLRCYLHSSDEDLVQADPDGWIEWQGGECPLPEGADFEAKRRDGAIIGKISVNFWGRGEKDRHSDIIAYRPILDKQATLAGAKLWQDAEGTIPVTRHGQPVRRLGEPERPAWDGEGPPPTGCECEARDDYGQWQRCRIVGVEGDQLWVDFADDGYVTRHINDIDIRPIRSDEVRAIDDMVEAIVSHYENPKGAEQYKGLARALYRAGYRKAAAADGRRDDQAKR